MGRIVQHCYWNFGGCKTRILHFDIKSHSIHLHEDFCPKISDFGHGKFKSCRVENKVHIYLFLLVILSKVGFLIKYLNIMNLR